MSTLTLLDELYIKYDISNLNFGKVGDKLGDLYEEFIVEILRSPELLYHFNKSPFVKSLEFEMFSKILYSCKLSPDSGIEKIEATSDVKHRTTGGPSKTDVIATVYFRNRDSREYPISVKQSTVPKVAFAEFDVDTISREVGITDLRLIWLLKKHQADKSAKNFTRQEKDDLKRLIEPIAKKFVRWVITGSTVDCDDIRIPVCLVKLQTAKLTYELLYFSVLNIDDYVDHIMVGKNGAIKSGGFGTGLSWTYATGSGGKKIQFKA